MSSQSFRRTSERDDNPFTGPTDAAGLPTTYVGNWQQFTNLTPAQQAWFRSQPQWLATYTQRRRWQNEVGSITVNGVVVPTHGDGVAFIALLRTQVMQDQAKGVNTSYDQVFDGQTLSLPDAAAALAFCDAVANHVFKGRNAEAQIVDGIVNGKIKSQADVDAALASAAPTTVTPQGVPAPAPVHAMLK
jgi:hypothetical protein